MKRKSRKTHVITDGNRITKHKFGDSLVEIKVGDIAVDIDPKGGFPRVTWITDKKTGNALRKAMKVWQKRYKGRRVTIYQYMGWKKIPLK